MAGAVTIDELQKALIYKELIIKLLHQRNDNLSDIIIQKETALTDAWSYFNTIESKSDEEREIYSKIIKALNIGHNPMTDEEIQILINQ